MSIAVGSLGNLTSEEPVTVTKCIAPSVIPIVHQTLFAVGKLILLGDGSLSVDGVGTEFGDGLPMVLEIRRKKFAHEERIWA